VSLWAGLSRVPSMSMAMRWTGLGWCGISIRLNVRAVQGGVQASGSG
jgi:hypothetical protein